MGKNKNKPQPENPFLGLEKVFHEPNRLAILSALCAAGNKGLTFGEIRDECDLTDGNLSRHLKTLEEAGVVHIEKEFVGAKPRTTVFLTDSGWEQFIAYLDNLEAVLQTAARAASTRKSKAARPAARLVPRPAGT